MITESLLKRFPLITDQVDSRELGVVLRELERLLLRGEEGAVVEFGCYAGTTSLFIRRLIDLYQLGNDFHVYDSFQGLPDKTPADEGPAGDQFQVGQLSVSKKDFIREFTRAHLDLPYIHKAWFSQIESHDVPNLIIFAFLDGDYFESISDSLRLITPKLASHAVIVVDDYVNEALPGAAKAVDEWLMHHPGARLRVEASLAIITL